MRDDFGVPVTVPSGVLNTHNVPDGAMDKRQIGNMKTQHDTTAAGAGPAGHTPSSTSTQMRIKKRSGQPELVDINKIVRAVKTAVIPARVYSHT